MVQHIWIFLPLLCSQNPETMETFCQIPDFRTWTRRCNTKLVNWAEGSIIKILSLLQQMLDLNKDSVARNECNIKPKVWTFTTFWSIRSDESFQHLSAIEIKDGSFSCLWVRNRGNMSSTRNQTHYLVDYRETTGCEMHMTRSLLCKLWTLLRMQ